MWHKLQPTRRCSFNSWPAWAFCVLILGTGPAVQAITPGETAAALKQLSFDPQKCWRVRDLNLAREDVKIYLTEGYLILSQPVGNGPVAALFTTDIEHGDGEVIVMPPTQEERRTMARFTPSPNLNEHFKNALLLFTDGTGAELLRLVEETAAKPAPEMGALLADQFNATVRNLTASFETRLVQDIAGEVSPEFGLMFTALGGTRLGNFDVIYDPQSQDQVSVGQLQYLNERSYYNIWANFPARKYRRGDAAPPPIREFQIRHVKIDAALDADLQLTATTTLQVQIPEQHSLRKLRNALSFDISRRVRVREAFVDGKPVQVMQRENLRSTLLRGNENEVFLLALEENLAPGDHTVEFRQEGNVVMSAGNNVYFVGARGTWYPHHGLQFATYEIDFRYPKHLTLVATGDLLEEKEEGDFKITRRATTVPLRIAGFNVGEYKVSRIKRGELKIEIFANLSVETALTPTRRDVIVTPAPPAFPQRGQPRRPSMDAVLLPPPTPPDPSQSLTRLADDVAEAFEFLSARLGPPPLKSLAVSPIPGAFGQGFPGLIYLSTLAYLPPKDRPQFANQGIQQTFFSELLVAHEVAHQWWGNSVATSGYRDEWMMEALANYCALLLLERKRGPKAIETILDQYRVDLMAKTPAGATLESAGPVRLGARLETSETPRAYRAIVYEKGSWILHMLRRRAGDDNFFRMLRQINSQYARGRFTTSNLRELAVQHSPKGLPDPALETFFTAYVESTGIPNLRLATRTRRTPKGTIVSLDLEQSGVPESFTIDVPVELDFGRGRTQMRWIRTEGERTSAEWTFPTPPLKITLDPANALLAIKR